ncbi:MAG TPA: PilZ domain-containing protein [Deltaproteobacteria bacterium]|nr:PilZ domain-containing protein [Deltaproteobacteria bacterium]HPJ93991.1 PilZ domain-containing protein [Deltaproteobacteria bacterium]HPR52701.1 PilZ domain-containing protein [Deltaproteobacteria bacterium]
MNIDNLLDLQEGVYALSTAGDKVPGSVREIFGDDIFIFSPEKTLGIEQGSLVKISDGQDSILAKVVEHTEDGIKMCIECYASPGNERRQDVRIYDKVYFTAKFLCKENEKGKVLPAALERIKANKLIIDSFLKGKYGYPGVDEMPYTKESPYNQALWEMNRKLDLLIHMYLAEDFKDLMGTSPRDVNISASGIRFITDDEFELGDVVEVKMILPMVPLLFIRFVGDVIRLKSVTSYETPRSAATIQFLQVDPETKDDIIRYLFRRQRELIRMRQD